ncbi:MAG TPA: nucleotidyltransferase domain-containing protein [Armatimonadota bacterium]|jgi:predicted nucleotidyltransferase
MAAETLNLPEDLRQALDQAVAAIVEIAHPELVILFGSWAEGTARPDSDVDLLVVAETDNPHRLTGQLRKAIRPFFPDTPLDVVLLTPERWEWARGIRGFVARQADRKGMRLHAA